MKRLTYVFCAVALGVSAIATVRTNAYSDARSVIGAGRGTFSAGATLGAVALQGMELGTGVLIEADGSASGIFHAVLQGNSAGDARALTVEGNVSEGSIGADGRATFSGTASFDFGDGTPPLPGVPFQVIAGADGVVLAINSTTLPAAGFAAGGVTVD